MKFLIVDDSNFSQKILVNTVKKIILDCEFVFASDGIEGFEVYKKENPDYTMVDLLMPKLSGGELIRLIKEYDNSAKIIVVTADIQQKVKDEIEALGVLAFINKPVNVEKIAPLFNNIIKEN